MADFPPVVYKIGYSCIKLYRLVFRPVCVGVHACVFNQKGEVLLVRHTYRPGWGFPGGSVNRGEDVSEAIQRELKEEVGLICNSTPELVPGVFYYFVGGMHDHIILFSVRETTEIKEFKGCGEIAEARYFPIDRLPEGIPTAIRSRITEISSSNSEIKFRWQTN